MDPGETLASGVVLLGGTFAFGVFMSRPGCVASEPGVSAAFLALAAVDGCPGWVHVFAAASVAVFSARCSSVRLDEPLGRPRPFLGCVADVISGGDASILLAASFPSLVALSAAVSASCAEESLSSVALYELGELSLLLLLLLLLLLPSQPGRLTVKEKSDV